MYRSKRKKKKLSYISNKRQTHIFSNSNHDYVDYVFLVAFEKASNSGCQSCMSILLSVNEGLVVASEQNLQDLFHGRPG
jgi:hypothetical protein